MKNKKMKLMVLSIFISLTGFSQSIVHTYSAQKDTTLSNLTNYNKEKIISYRDKNEIQNEPVQKHMYRDTRLGSSSPAYDTYEKNDYGAGAITNNPNK
jgi:hypothetical protein